MENRRSDSSDSNKVSLSFQKTQKQSFTTKKRKIIVLGAPGVGKSALIVRFKDDIFFDFYDPTIQNTYKKIFPFNNENIELEIIDLDGQTENTIFSVTKFSYGIHGYILTYSIDNFQSFELIRILHSKLVSLVGRDVPKILIGTKCDLGVRVISTEEGKNLSKEIDCGFFECSAKSGFNVNKVFHGILVHINKYENNVDIKKLGCHKIFEFFIQRESLMIKLFYVLICLSFILACFMVVFPFIIRDFVNKFQTHTIIFLFSGLWVVLFSFVGFYGSYSRKKDYLNYFFISLIISLLLFFFNVIYNALYQDDQNRKTFYDLGLATSIGSLIIQIIILLFTLVLKKTVGEDLNSYIAL